MKLLDLYVRSRNFKRLIVVMVTQLFFCRYWRPGLNFLCKISRFPYAIMSTVPALFSIPLRDRLCSNISVTVLCLRISQAVDNYRFVLLQELAPVRTAAKFASPKSNVYGRIELALSTKASVSPETHGPKSGDSEVSSLSTKPEYQMMFSQ